MSTPSRPFADAVVLAAGSSRRMGGIDKLRADLAGQPLLRWSVAALAGATSVQDTIVVGAPDASEALAREPWLAALGARVVAGGDRRQDSVLAGVRAATADVVLVHDGARPFPSSVLVDAVATAAARDGAAIPVLPVADLLKRLEGNAVQPGPDRASLARAQTPQGARRELLLGAFAAAGDAQHGDEASLLAAAGIRVTAVPGETANFKVTEAADLDLALVIRRGSRRRRPIGTGRDSHPFGPARGLRLGGIEIADAPRLAGHSDGDVVLHAVSDALLSAASAGDLGRWFPSDASTPRGVDSRALLTSVVDRLAGMGVHADSAQVSILGARPRLGARLDAIRDAVAGLLGLPVERVSVSAATGNLSADEGAGRVISASALVTVTGR